MESAPTSGLRQPAFAAGTEFALLNQLIVHEARSVTKCDKRDRMHNQASRAMFDYWLNVKGNEMAPLRADIDPIALRHLLPHLFILARDEQDTLAFRLAGTRICDLRDREFRDSAFVALWANESRNLPVAVAEHTLRYELPAMLQVSAGNSRNSYAYEMLLLPLRSRGDAPCDRVLGALLPQTKHVASVDLPIKGLTLQNWTFLSGDESHFGVPVVADHRGMNDDHNFLADRRNSA